MSTLVRLDADRQVVVGASAAGRPLWATWGLHEPPDVHSWPCVAPDDRRWAALRVGREGGAARVVISTADAIETETEPLDGIPVCLQWSPAGARLAVLVQRAEGLALLVVDAGGGRAEVWCAGSPLFFAWIDEGRIAVHVGRGGGRTEVAVLEGGR